VQGIKVELNLKLFTGKVGRSFVDETKSKKLLLMDFHQWVKLTPREKK
jgi:hypothetical protein